MKELKIIDIKGKPIKQLPPQEDLADYCAELRNSRQINRNVLLIKTPDLSIGLFEPALARNRSYQVYPPVGLQYLAQALESQNLDVKILDMNYELLKRANFQPSFNHKNWISILEERLKEDNPSIIGVSNMFEVYEQGFNDVLNYLRQEGSRILITGGTNATYKAKELLEKKLCDVVIEREAENKISYFFSQLYQNFEALPTPGINFSLKGEIKTTGKGNDVVENKGNLIEQHKKLPIEEYYKVGTLGPMSRMAGSDKPFATPIITRGCRFKCSFCSVRSFNGPGIRNRDLENILEELKFLYKEKGIRHFEFLDDDLGGGNKEYILDVLDSISHRGMDITWSAQNGMIAKYLDDDLLKAFEESKCIGFKVGVETGNKEMLRHVEKPGTLENFRAFAQRMKSHSQLIVPHNYIIGFSDETFRYMMDTYWFSGEIQTDWSAFSIYQPIADKKKEGDKADVNFIPAKSRQKMEITPSEGVLSGTDIFHLPLDKVPSHSQISQIWNSFNMARNFIHNINLKPEGKPEKFIKYVGALQENYPLNSYMPFFLSLAHLSLNNFPDAEKYYLRTIKNQTKGVGDTFDKFRLTEILKYFPKTSKDAKETLHYLREKHSWYETQESFMKQRYNKGIKI